MENFSASSVNAAAPSCGHKVSGAYCDDYPPTLRTPKISEAVMWRRSPIVLCWLVGPIKRLMGKPSATWTIVETKSHRRSSATPWRSTFGGPPRSSGGSSSPTTLFVVCLSFTEETEVDNLKLKSLAKGWMRSTPSTSSTETAVANTSL